MKRRQAIAWPGALALSTAATAAAAADPARKVLRVAFRVAETGFDPAQVNDLYSRTVTPHIFEAPYQYDPLARPARVRPLTAVDMPEHADGWRTWTVRIRPGIFFADDPAFKGVPRELTAADYAYTFKRYADPAVKSPNWGWMDGFGILGLAELRRESLDTRKPFDYDRPIEGLQVLDRHTLRFRLKEARPRFVTSALASSDLVGALAREVVEAYGDQIAAHPVGTGPFRLAQWRRSSFIALERNPRYREVLYDAAPAAGDAEGQAVLRRLKGRRLPLVDRVEISIIEGNQPRWLSFLQGALDVLEEVPPEYVEQAMPGGQVAPHLARRGVRGQTMVRAATDYTIFNLDDPVVGGLQPHQVALRRAIALATDVKTEIQRVRRGQAIVAQAPANPHTYAYDPAFRSENGTYDLPRAKALLELYGYVDRDGDGWRERPDGTPLVLRINTQADATAREQDEMWRRDMKALGLRTEFLPAKWPENLKAARAGKFQIWSVGGLSNDPDGQSAFQRYHSQHIGGQNMARVRMPAIDNLYDRISALPDGPERKAAFTQLRRLTLVHMPYKARTHRLVTDLVQPQVLGYRRPLFWQDWWQYVDLAGTEAPA
ncbi:MAG: bicyclomycin resistance protein [Rubrivivax sp.]|nr:bicyclomycin resistance protein [Rubrivivax sp.]